MKLPTIAGGLCLLAFCSAALAQDAITIGVVNPNAKPQSIDVKFAGVKTGGTAKVWTIAGDDPEATNTPEKQGVKINEKASVPFGERIEVPAFSVIVYRVPLK